MSRVWKKRAKSMPLTPETDYCEVSSDGYQVRKLRTQAGGYIVYAPNASAWIPETASGTIKGAKAYLEKLE